MDIYSLSDWQRGPVKIASTNQSGTSGRLNFSWRDSIGGPLHIPIITGPCVGPGTWVQFEADYDFPSDLFPPGRYRYVYSLWKNGPPNDPDAQRVTQPTQIDFWVTDEDAPYPVDKSTVWSKTTQDCIYLKWRMHADVRDFKGYYITRFGPDGTKTILPSPNASHDPYFEYSWLADTSIQANQVYAYEITAVDWAGKRSAPTRIEPQYVVAAPVFDPPGNQLFSAPVNVTMRCTTVGAEIRYTLDGTDPKDNPSAQTYIFGNPLLFSTTTKLTARAKVGNVWSELTSAVFNIVKPKCSTPVFSPISGTYPIGTKITILCDNPTDASIKYRIDNDIWLGPVTSGSQITIPSGTHTLIAYALKPGFEDSDQTPPAKYTFSPTAIGEIKFNPDGGNYASPQVVKIICETSGVEIRYAFNRDPVSTDYLVPNGGTVLIDNTCALRARAWKDGISSDVKSAFYQIQQNNATVSFDPDGGEFLEPRGVQIRCSAPKLYVYYTIDGRDPTDKDNDGCGLGGAYVYVDRSLTLKARAYKGITPSVIKSATYMVDTKKVAMPVFTPSGEGGGCISSEQFVSISCSTPGAVIHYAMEFRDPTENDPVYTGPIRITQSPQNISARAFKAGYRPSDTKFGLYHLKLTPPVLTPDGVCIEILFMLLSTSPVMIILSSSQPMAAIQYLMDKYIQHPSI